MAVIKFKAEIQCELDTDEYAIPVDDRLAEQLRDDVRDAIEETLCVAVNSVKITGAKIKYEDNHNGR